MSILWKIFLLLIILVLPLKLFSQIKEDTPIQPALTKPQKELGAFIGLGSNFTSGTFKVDCEACEFSNATGFGITAGILYEQDISRYFQWGGIAFIDYSEANSSYIHKVERDAIIEGGNTSVRAKMTFEQNAQSYFLMAGAGPSIRWSPTDWFFIRNALTAGLILNTHLKHEETLLSRKGEVVETGEVVDNLYVEEPYSEEGEFHDVNNFQAGLLSMIGFNIRAGLNIEFTPGLMFYLPFTPVSSSGEGLTMYKWRAFLELRVLLELRRQR